MPPLTLEYDVWKAVIALDEDGIMLLAAVIMIGVGP